MTFDLALFPAELLGYLALSRLVVRQMRGNTRDFAFAALNLGVLYLLFFRPNGPHALPAFLSYLALVLFQYASLRFCAQKEGWTPWLAFFIPILALIWIRYAPAYFWQNGWLTYAPYFIGISYLAFRSSHLVLEVRNGTVAPPGLFAYLGFCFFVPTMSVGPINPYSHFQSAFGPEPPSIPPARAALRVLIGLVKYKFLGSVCFQLTYSIFLLNGHYHTWIDLPIAAVFYYLFLYCNFSGFCDIAIGAAGLMGIPVIENFDNPMAARNMREFWNRWHISLSQYMRDVVFSPLSKYLARLFGPTNVNHAIALTVLVVFLLIGVWHGTGWNYILFGLAQAIGVIITHYYTIGLKRWLGRDGFKAYNANPWIHATAVCITFCYFSASLFFFANTPADMQEIFAAMR